MSRSLKSCLVLTLATTFTLASGMAWADPPRAMAKPNAMTDGVAKTRKDLSRNLQSLADRAMQTGEFDDAARTYAKAALVAPDNPILRMLTGVALATIRQPGAAASQFQQACRLTDDDLIASLLLQGALAERGDVDAAQTVYLDAVRRWGKQKNNSGRLDPAESLKLLNSARAASPNSPILYLLLGDAYQIGEQWASADAAYRKAIGLAPGWTKPRVNLGLSRLAQGNTTEAIKIFEQAIARDPENVQVLFYRADAQRQAGDLPAAISSYRSIEKQKVAQKQPAVVAQALTGLGQAYAANGQFDSARAVLSRAQTIAPTDPAPPAALAEVQTRQKDFRGAAVSYDAALRLTKASGLFGTQAVLYQALAQTQISARQSDAALNTLTRAMADEPDSLFLWQRMRGDALLIAGDNAGAENAFRAALEAQTGAGIFPQDTLADIASHGMLVAIASSYLADLTESPGSGHIRNSAGGFGGGSVNGSPTIVMRAAGPAASSAEREAKAHAALAVIAQYRGDTSGEREHREALTQLRSRASDWFTLAETYEQRVRDAARAKMAYTKALNLGGLTEVQANRARAKVRILTNSGTPNP